MTEQKKIMVIHGPNLNMLGKREPEVYGTATLEDVNRMLVQRATELDLVVEAFQSNHEGELVGAIQAAVDTCHGMIINPAAYTHTSVAIRDALLAVEIPFVEVHLSAVSAREPFRQVSYFSDIAIGVISGFRGESYLLALQAILNRIEP